MQVKKTSEVTHTPGPWEVAGLTVYESDKWKDGQNSGGRIIAACYDPEVEQLDNEDSIHISERAANTRLIAAAPELLEACKGGLVALEELAVIANSWYPDTYSQISKARDIARAAIAKATGATATLAPLKEQL